MQRESSDSVKIYYPQFRKEELIRILKDRSRILSQKLPLVSVVLFGSYAKNRHTAASDIDLLVVYRDPKREDDYSVTWDVLDIPLLEPHVYTLSEYERLARQNSWLPKVTKKEGVVIYQEFEIAPSL